MATITPSDTRTGGIAVVSWSGVTTGDTVVGYAPGGQAALAAMVQMTSSAWAGTHVLQVSNDGATWATCKDINGTDISFTANGVAEFSTSARYIRPSPSGGAAEDVTVTVCLRG